MLCGEYHVLTRGAQALAFALVAYLEIYVRYGTAARQSLLLHSNLWEMPRRVDAQTGHDSMLVATVGALMPPGKHRIEEIRINSQLHPSYGFGSSSALRLGLVYIAYLQTCGGSLLVPQAKRWQLARQAFALQKKSQQLASGYDVATQLVGGIVTYRSEGGEWPPSPNVQSLPAHTEKNARSNLKNCVHLFVGGRGTNTRTVTHATQNWLATQRQLPLAVVSDRLRCAFLGTLHDLHNLPTLIAATAQWREWFASSPHFPRRVDTALHGVHGRDREWSWKTSGAGGEDALIVIGLQQNITAVTARLAALGWQRYHYNIATHGIHWQRV